MGHNIHGEKIYQEGLTENKDIWITMLALNSWP